MIYKFFQAKYIAECIDEIKQELKQENVAVKANAVSKLSYVRFKDFFLILTHHELILFSLFSTLMNVYISGFLFLLKCLHGFVYIYTKINMCTKCIYIICWRSWLKLNEVF